MYSVVDAVLLEPLPYPAPDQLAVVYNQYPTLGVERGAQSPGDLADYMEQAGDVADYGSVSTFPQTLIEDGLPSLGVVYAPARTRLFWTDEDGRALEESGTVRPGKIEDARELRMDQPDN